MTNEHPEDRRRAERRYYRIHVICQRGPEGLDEILNAQLLNVSTTGAQIIANGAFDKDERFYLAMVNAMRETVAERHCTIHWQKEEAPRVKPARRLFRRAAYRRAGRRLILANDGRIDVG